jgi:hypothetical protein
VDDGWRLGADVAATAAAARSQLVRILESFVYRLGALRAQMPALQAQTPAAARPDGRDATAMATDNAAPASTAPIAGATAAAAAVAAAATGDEGPVTNSPDLDLTYAAPIRVVVPPDSPGETLRDVRFLFRTIISGVKNLSTEIMRGTQATAAAASAANAANPAPPFSYGRVLALSRCAVHL